MKRHQFIVLGPYASDLGPRSGFTLIELLVAITIMVMVFALGLFIDTRFYHRASIDAERDTVVSLLSRARSEALNNIDQTGHGFYIASSSYVVFEGSTYATRTASLDQSFPMGSGISISGNNEFDFKALEGSPVASGTVTLSNEAKSLSVSVNQEGMISW